MRLFRAHSVDETTPLLCLDFKQKTKSKTKARKHRNERKSNEHQLINGHVTVKLKRQLKKIFSTENRTTEAKRLHDTKLNRYLLLKERQRQRQTETKELDLRWALT